MGLELGNGWWNPLSLKFWGHTDIRGALTVGQGRGNGTTTEPMFRLKIVGTMSDGTHTTLLTSSSSSSGAGGAAWSAASSPTTFNSIYLGEKYDATMESAPGNGWSTVSAHDSDSDRDAAAWAPAVPASQPHIIQSKWCHALEMCLAPSTDVCLGPNTSGNGA